MARSQNDQLTCKEYDLEGNETLETYDMNMNKSARNLYIMHFFVFFGQMASKMLESLNLNFHTSVFLHLTSIFIYMTIILTIKYDIYEVLN